MDKIFVRYPPFCSDWTGKRAFAACGEAIACQKPHKGVANGRQTFQREGGSCRCGRARLWGDARPLVTMACYCTGCQKMNFSAYSLSATIPT